MRAADGVTDAVVVKGQLERFLHSALGHVVAVSVTIHRSVSESDTVSAQAKVELDGHTIRAQVVAVHHDIVSDMLCARLAMQIARLDTPWSPRPWPPEGPIGNPHQHAAAGGFGNPLETCGSSYRYKIYALARCAADDAALIMDLLDYDFHLFIDQETGQDSVIARVGPTGYRLTRTASMTPPVSPRLPITVNPYPVARRTVEESARFLSRAEMPFEFFINSTSGRGNVLYRRLAGNFGLIKPDNVVARKPTGNNATHLHKEPVVTKSVGRLFLTPNTPPSVPGDCL